MSNKTLKTVIMCEHGVAEGSTIRTYVEDTMRQEELDYAALILSQMVAVDSATREGRVDIAGAYIAGFQMSGKWLRLCMLGRVVDGGELRKVCSTELRGIERIILSCVRDGLQGRQPVMHSWILRADQVTVSQLDVAMEDKFI